MDPDHSVPVPVPVPVLEQEQALDLSYAALDNLVGNYHFLNQDGENVNLTDYLGKPLVVSFIYTSCYHFCPTITSNLKAVVEVAREALGDNSFAIVSIGFDSNVDTPERMRSFAKQRGIDFRGWDFLSGDAATIAAITADLGFSFATSAKGFDHLAQSTVLDAQGMVYRQILGVNYEPPVLVEPLKELIYGQRNTNRGRISEWVDGIKLFCTVYDPTSGKYYFDYSILVMIGTGLLCLISVAAFIIHAWRQNKII